MPQKTPIKGPQIKKDVLQRKTQADSDSSVLNRTPEGLLKLPDMEGITYQVVPAQNGQQCIVAREIRFLTKIRSWLPGSNGTPNEKSGGSMPYN